MTQGGNWLRWASIGAVLINLGAIGAHYWLAYKSTINQPVRPGTMVGPIAGITSSGAIITEDSMNAYPCHVIRYTSIHCPWCRRDEPTWTRFDETLRSHGCDTTILGPSGGDLSPNATLTPNQRSVVAVPAFVAQNIDLAVTPTTIVLDKNWKIVWSNRGILKAEDVEKALGSLATSNQHSAISN
jgi:hypothetical protein